MKQKWQIRTENWDFCLPWQYAWDKYTDNDEVTDPNDRLTKCKASELDLRTIAEK